MRGSERGAARTRRRLRRQDAVAVVALLLAVAWLLRGPLFRDEVLYFRDLQVFFVPMKQFLADSLRQGVLPFWDSAVLAGRPFFADPQSGALYPPSLLLLIRDPAHALGPLIVFHLALAALATYAYGRFLGQARPAACASAAVYALGGWTVSSINMVNLLQAAAWTPLVLLAFERDTEAPSWRRAALAAGVVALQVLAGAPDVTVMTGMVALARLVTVGAGARLRGLARLVTIYAAAAVLCAPQLVAAYEAFTLSNRYGGLPVTEILEQSLRFSDLQRLVLPPPLSSSDWDIFTTYPGGQVPLFLSLYVGWAAAALALLALVRGGRAGRFWLGVAVAGAFLALGANNPAAVPFHRLLAVFRFPEKYAYLLHLGLSLAAGWGVHSMSGRLRNGPASRVAWGVTLLCILEVVAVNQRVNLTVRSDYYDLRDVPELALLRRGEPARVYHRDHYRENVTSVRHLYATYRRELVPNVARIAGVEHVGGVEFLNVGGHQVMLGLVENVPPSERLARRLAFLGVRYVLTSDPSFASSPDWTRAAQRKTELLWEIDRVAPRIFVPETVVARASQGLGEVSEHAGYSTGRQAFVAQGERVGHGLRGVVVSGSPRPNGMSAFVRAETEALVVWLESDYPGWSASIDGKAARVVRANGLFMGVWVPAGEHRVEFRFVPTGFIPASAVALLGWLVVLGLLTVRLPRQEAQASVG